ncbi:MAG: phosphopentomutase [Bacillota bacterium]
MKKYNRIFLIVLDSLGIGKAPDSHEYGDFDVDTFGHIAEKMENFHIPNLQKLGIGNLHSLQNVPPVNSPLAKYGTLIPRGKGKDTLTGHWEMMGISIDSPFQTFTETGFPEELIQLLEERTGKKIIGNKSASGTEILDELAERELLHDELIVYTSSDSVLQICGNEETMGLKMLYRYCKIARELTMKEEWRVGRVIARPYIGKEKGKFKRTENRHDYAVKPYEDSYLIALKEAGLDVISIGKINDIFVGEGITNSNPSKSSVHGMEQTIDFAKSEFYGLCFTNLVDFDAVYGHRRDPIGYGKEIEKFDKKLGELLELLRDDDLLILTADHGNDPTYTGTDHTRECVPLLAYGKQMKQGESIGEFDSFAVVGATIAENFSVYDSFIAKNENLIGQSILEKLS